MIPKIIKFLDKHRFILIILILILITVIFLSIKSFFFLNKQFKPLECLKNLDNNSCKYKNIEIFKNPEKSKKEFLKEYSKSIADLQAKYKLPNLNFYTSYFYEVAANLEYNMTMDSVLKEVYLFFQTYNNTYKLKEFYQENPIYYNIFYPYKLPINFE